MAFFGLTALGAQNPLSTALETRLHIFSEEDFKEAWDRVQHDDMISYEDIDCILLALYQVPKGDAPPVNALRACNAKFFGKSEISYSEYTKGIKELVEDSINECGYSQKDIIYDSNSQYRNEMNKHVRTKNGPNDIYNKPITCSHDIGWEKQEKDEAVAPNRRRKSCEETRYASEMVKAGILY